MSTETTNLLNTVDLDAVAALTAAVRNDPAAGNTTWGAEVTCPGAAGSLQ